MTGRVKMISGDRRFGFIAADDGSEWYVRTSDVGDLRKGDRVEFRDVRLSDDRTFALDIVKRKATLAREVDHAEEN